MARKRVGPQVEYVPAQLRKRARLTPREHEVLTFIQKVKRATFRDLVKGLPKIPENGIVGAVYRLRRHGAIKSQPIRAPVSRAPAGEAPAVRRDGALTFSRQQAQAMLDHLSKPRTMIWDALRLPVGPSNRAVRQWLTTH